VGAARSSAVGLANVAAYIAAYIAPGDPLAGVGMSGAGGPGGGPRWPSPRSPRWAALWRQDPELAQLPLGWWWRASPARVRSVLLGEPRTSYACDRDAADRLLEICPQWGPAVQGARLYTVSTVRRLAKAGMTQFLVLGCGLPVDGSVHEIAIGPPAEPWTYTVFVDTDPLVLAWARALWAFPRTAVIDWDPRDPNAAGPWDAPAAQVLDWRRPIGVVLEGWLECLTDEAAARLLTGVCQHVAAGSPIILTHLSDDPAAFASPIHRTSVQRASARRAGHRQAALRAAAALYQREVGPCRPRTAAQLEGLLAASGASGASGASAPAAAAAATLIPPGIVPAGTWLAQYAGQPAQLERWLAQYAGAPVLVGTAVVGGRDTWPQPPGGPGPARE
jgi:hypothetical protein